jgi:hypothetical protein
MRHAERARGLRPVAVALSLLVAACGTIEPQVAYPTVRGGQPPAEPGSGLAPSQNPWAKTLAALRIDDQRVADVAYRIVTANAELCADRKPQSGLVLQTALQYRPVLRRDAEDAFHIDDRAAIEAVAAGSPSAEAGLRRDDILIAVNGQLLATGAPPPPVAGPDERAATRAPVDEAEAALDAALAKGAARLRVQRGDEMPEVVLTPRIGCAYDAQVMPGPKLNAWADGRHVFISAALVDFARSDDALALFLGHEFAHDLLHHHQRLDEKGLAREVLGEFGSTPASQIIAEKEADYVGLYLMARAGYDISQAPDMRNGLPTVVGDFTHPGHAERAAALAATRDEIIAKRQRGERLSPNPAGRRSTAE